MTKRKTLTTTTVEEILSAHSPEIRAWVERLRAIIRETVPNAAETAHPGWHSISYRHPDGGYFCGVFPQSDIIAVAFEFGILLPDPDELLQGDGKQVRFVYIRQNKDIRVQAFKKLLLAAINLPGSKQVKLELIRTSAKPVNKG